MNTANKSFSKSPDLSKLAELNKMVDDDNIKSFIQGQSDSNDNNDNNEVKTESKAAIQVNLKNKQLSIAKVQHITRLPVQLKQYLEYFGETVYGESMNSICVEGITRMVEELAKEKGVTLPEDFRSWDNKSQNSKM